MLRKQESLVLTSAGSHDKEEYIAIFKQEPAILKQE